MTFTLQRNESQSRVATDPMRLNFYHVFLYRTIYNLLFTNSKCMSLFPFNSRGLISKIFFTRHFAVIPFACLAYYNITTGLTLFKRYRMNHRARMNPIAISITNPPTSTHNIAGRTIATILRAPGYVY